MSKVNVNSARDDYISNLTVGDIKGRNKKKILEAFENSMKRKASKNLLLKQQINKITDGYKSEETT